MSDKIDTLNRLWRPTGSWGLVLNVVILPSVFVAMAIFERGVTHLPTLIGLYTIIAGLFGALFGFRQWGKNKALDVQENIAIAEIEDDETAE